MFKSLIALRLSVVCMLVLVSCDSNQKRPRDPWVFRSVIDQRPRMITAALNDNMYVSYDASACQLHQAWRGDVSLDGAVYTTVHGPQPTSKGVMYFQQEDALDSWSLEVDGKPVSVNKQFKGYKFEDGRVVFQYSLSRPDGRNILVSESPEYIKRSNQHGLERVFKVQGLAASEKLFVNWRIPNLSSVDDVRSSEDFNILNNNTSQGPAGSTTTVETRFLINTKTTISVLFHDGLNELKEDESTTATPVNELERGAQLIEGSDCKTCHNETVKTIGPSYIDVAKKYDYSDATIKRLAGKIISGGAGVWGEVQMTAHPDLPEKDAIAMTKYILSLDGEKPEDETPQANTDVTNPVLFSFSEANEFEKLEEGKEYPGLAVSAYRIESYNQDFYAMPKNFDPVYTAVAPALHFRGELFDKTPSIQEDVLLHIRGTINIEKDENMVFRLISDDGSKLYLDNKLLIDNDGFHGAEAKDGEILVKKGKHPIEIYFFQGKGGCTLSLQWAKHGESGFKMIPASVFTHTKSMFKKSVPFIPLSKLVRSVPGDRHDEAGVHPSFTLSQARPSTFEPKVGGMDFLSDGSLIVCTWDSVGPVYRLEGVTGNDPDKIKVTRIASGLAEPLGLKVINDTIYVLQKHELTRLIDNDNDGITDEYQTVSDQWRVSANFHEFAFGLAYKDGYFYAALATAIMPGGASANPQIPDRGKAIRISKKDGSVEFIASGLRTPNGVGIGIDGELFITDNQGDWLPSSKVLHVTPGAWFGSRSVDFEGTANLKEKLPVVWLPQDEIGNSPSQPVAINVGPYKGQQLHGEVTHGGLKRVFAEKVNGEYQGAVFRFTQGLEGGVNRVVWGPDSALYIGMIGNPGNWNHQGTKWYGLQKLKYNGNTAFEMLAVKAKSNGLEVEMTEPIAEGYGNAVGDYEVQQWRYQPTADYGGPKLDHKTLEVKSVSISDDRKKLFLEIKGVEPDRVVYLRLKGIFLSESNQNLWSTEAWYTMNQIPTDNYGTVKPQVVVKNNTLTDAEKQAGWKLLFDGKTTAGWRTFKSDKIGSAWKVKDGALTLDTSKKNGWQVEGGGDIVTEDEYENFELILEWKIQKCGNSGVIFNVVEDEKYEYVWQTGPEMQILDNVCHPDARIEKHRAGDLYDLVESKFVSVYPAGEWNQARLVSNKGKYEFWLNGYKSVEFEMHTPEWDNMIKASKFKDMPAFGKATKGKISLQDHGDQIWFRNIKIREIK